MILQNNKIGISYIVNIIRNIAILRIMFTIWLFGSGDKCIIYLDHFYKLLMLIN